MASSEKKMSADEFLTNNSLNNRNFDDSSATNMNSQSNTNSYDPNQGVRPRYRNAREYAQALQPWLWHYHNYNSMNMMNTFFATMPLYAMNCNPPTGMPWVQTAGVSPQTDVPSGPARTQNAQRAGLNHHVQNAHGPGREYLVPSFWTRVAAELIDFTLLFYVKLIVTVIVMRELGYLNGTHIQELFYDLNEIDYDKAFAISSEVIAMEIVNRLLITIFETLCLRKGIGTVGGATPGKRILGLKVVSCRDIFEVANGRVFVVPAENIGWVNALLRSVIKNFTIAFFFPACLTIFFFKHNQAMYDVLSKTIVVQTVEGEL